MPKKKAPCRKIEREIVVGLEAEEIRAKAMEAASLAADLKKLKEEKKEAVDDFKDKIDGKQSRLDELLSQINEQTEKRMVICEIKKVFERNAIEYWHGGKKVDERAMDDSDRQEELLDSGTPKSVPAADDGKPIDGIYDGKGNGQDPLKS